MFLISLVRSYLLEKMTANSCKHIVWLEKSILYIINMFLLLTGSSWSSFHYITQPLSGRSETGRVEGKDEEGEEVFFWECEEKKLNSQTRGNGGALTHWTGVCLIFVIFKYLRKVSQTNNSFREWRNPLSTPPLTQRSSPVSLSPRVYNHQTGKDCVLFFRWAPV